MKTGDFSFSFPLILRVLRVISFSFPLTLWDLRAFSIILRFARTRK